VNLRAVISSLKAETFAPTAFYFIAAFERMRIVSMANSTSFKAFAFSIFSKVFSQTEYYFSVK
jgi:hypothetical protein